MSTAVIKIAGAEAPAGAKKLYGDVVATEGTLLIIDFSNKGTLDNFNVNSGAVVRNIASGATSGVSANGVVNTGVTNELTPGRGFSMEGKTVTGINRGLYISGSFLNHLRVNQPHSLAILWFRINPNPDPFDTSNGFIQSLKGTSLTSRFLFATKNPSTTVGYFGNGNGTVNSSLGELIQMGFEYNGVGNKLNVYKNNTLIGEGSTDAIGFEETDAIILNLVNNSTRPSPVANYRIVIEDLDLSGRSAVDVLNQDFNYVHALGEFEGIPKRPFVDEY